jgi:hypothetical protein
MIGGNLGHREVQVSSAVPAVGDRVVAWPAEYLRGDAGDLHDATSVGWIGEYCAADADGLSNARTVTMAVPEQRGSAADGPRRINVTLAWVRIESPRSLLVSQNVRDHLTITANRGQMVAQGLRSAAMKVPLVKRGRETQMRDAGGFPEHCFGPPIGFVAFAA